MIKTSTRRLCLLLCLYLLPLLGLAQEHQAPASLFQEELIDDGQELRSMAIADGKAYLVTGNALFRYAPGDDRAREIARLNAYSAPLQEGTEPLPVNFLFTGADGQLMGMSNQRGQLYRLRDEGQRVSAELVRELDWSAFTPTEADQENAKEYPAYLVVSGSKLYCRINNYGNAEKPELFEVDLEGGQSRALTTRHLHKPVPYRDGKLLALFFDRSAVDPQTNLGEPAKLCVYDPAKDQVELLPHQLPHSRYDQGSQLMLYYQEEGGLIYAATDTQLMLLQEKGEPRPVASLPMASVWPSMRSPAVLPLAKGQALVAVGPNALLRGMDPDAYRPQTQLIHYGNYESRALMKALLRLPDLDVKLYEEGMLANDKLAQLLMSRELKADILQLDSAGVDLQRLVEKGYLMPLTGDAELEAYAKECWPQLQKLMFHEGKLYLLPTHLFAVRTLANTPAFQAIGREVPKTMAELLDLFDWWLKEGMARYPGTHLVDQPAVKVWLKQTALRTYMDGQIGAGETVQLDEARFGEIVRRIEAMDTTPMEIDPEEDPFSNGSDNGPSLEGEILIFSMNAISLENHSPNREPMMLAFDEQFQAYSQGMAEMVGISAFTAHPEEARRFLRGYLAALPPRYKGSVQQSWNQVVEHPRFERENERILQEIALMEKKIGETAEGAERRQLMEALATRKRDHEDFVREQRYLISPEGIKAYQLATRLCYVDNSLSKVQNQSFFSEQGSNLYQQYVQGLLPVEQFVKQANERLRLMLLEMK